MNDSPKSSYFSTACYNMIVTLYIHVVKLTSTPKPLPFKNLKLLFVYIADIVSAQYITEYRNCANDSAYGFAI